MLNRGSHRRPVARLLRRRPRVEPLVEVESDLSVYHAIADAELDAIEQLLGSELSALLSD